MELVEAAMNSTNGETQSSESPDRETSTTFETIEDIFLDLTDLLRPPERISISDASERYVRLNNPGSYIGPYRNDMAPYMVEPQNTLQSRLMTSTIFVGPAQSAKTQALILNWLAYSIRIDGMDMIIYSPTQSASRDFSMRRVDRMHRHSPEIGKMLLGSREADNVYDKQYVTGMLLNLSHPTVTEFAGRPVGRIALTDYDRMSDDIGGDGSPFDLGSKRTTTFRSFAMTVAESSPSRPVENPRWIATTPHEAPPCKGIMALYNRGDRRRWYWPCPHCGMYFEGQWKDMEWDVRNSVLASAETARLICPSNACVIEQEQRPTMQAWGVWLKDGQSIDPENGGVVGEGMRSTTASFWLNGIAANFTTWTNLVVSYLNALAEYDKTGSDDALKKFYNTDLGVPYLPKSQESELLPENLKVRAEVLPISEVTSAEVIDRIWNPKEVDFVMEPEVPANVRFIVATIDVQNNLFAVQVQGVLPGQPFDMIVIDRFQIRKSQRRDAQGDAEWVKPSAYLEDWNEITEQVLNRTYPLSDGSGRRMSIKLTGCDSGGREGVTTNGYNYFRLLRHSGDSGRFHLLKGDPLPTRPRAQIMFPDSNRKDRLAAARGDVPVMFFNSNQLKDALRGRIDCMVPGKGMLRYGKWLPDAWYSEMCVETRDDKGWHNPKHLRNEAWDLCYYALGFCVSSLIRVESIEWDSPPGWAAPWDKNDLVSAAQTKAFEPIRKDAEDVDFAAFGRMLGGSAG